MTVVMNAMMWNLWQSSHRLFYYCPVPQALIQRWSRWYAMHAEDDVISLTSMYEMQSMQRLHYERSNPRILMKGYRSQL
jgi:hypothetical protein